MSAIQFIRKMFLAQKYFILIKQENKQRKTISEIILIVRRQESNFALTAKTKQ